MRLRVLVVWLITTPSFAQELLFVDARVRSGIDYVNVSGELDKRHILSTLGSGVAVFDYDQDGDLDLFFANGARVVEGEVQEIASGRLYRNEGGWAFEDVTARAGIVRQGWGFGVAVGDVDDDGLPDLYVANVGPNFLYRNKGDGTFEEIGESAGIAHSGWSTSAAFFDADVDGDLDLYVGSYVDVDPSSIPPPENAARCQWFGIEVMCGPKGLPGAADVFYRNEGDGTFTDQTEEFGFFDATGAYALGVVTGDYDDDGDLDVYVANDSVPNFLYRNDGGGRFVESAFLSGVALSAEGLAQAGMGVDIGDLDGDGRLDLFVTNFSHETVSLYRNHGGGLFLDAVGEANLHGASWFSLGWGTRFVDFDQDGDLDIFVANGHVYPGVDATNLKTRYHQHNQIFWNEDGAFVEKTYAAGDAMSEVAASRAAAFGDLDGDGDVDGVVVNIDAAPTLLDNQITAVGSFVELRLIGRTGPRDAVGARTTIAAGGRRFVREVHPSGSFLSSSELRVHVGLGRASQVDGVHVRWPDGSVETLGPVPAGARVTVLQGLGMVRVVSDP